MRFRDADGGVLLPWFGSKRADMAYFQCLCKARLSRCRLRPHSQQTDPRVRSSVKSVIPGKEEEWMSFLHITSSHSLNFARLNLRFLQIYL